MHYAIAIRNTLPSVVDVESFSLSEETELNYVVKRLEEDIAKKNDVIERTSKVIEETTQMLNKRNASLAEEVDNLDTFLQAQLDIAQDEMQFEKSFFEGMEDDDLDEALDGLNKNSKEHQGNRELRKACRGLFKKIANLTHPDKVGHSHLVEIYQEALKASEELKLTVLQEIYEELKANKSSIKSIRERARKKLELRIQELKNKLVELEEELAELTASEEYDYAMYHRKHGENAVILKHRQDLRESRFELRRALTQLGFDPDNLPI